MSAGIEVGWGLLLSALSQRAWSPRAGLPLASPSGATTGSDGGGGGPETTHDDAPGEIGSATGTIGGIPKTAGSGLTSGLPRNAGNSYRTTRGASETVLEGSVSSQFTIRR